VAPQDAWTVRVRLTAGEWIALTEEAHRLGVSAAALALRKITRRG
jgi:HPt (histidine-containing phosphotransfer) domain-containing protein